MSWINKRIHSFGYAFNGLYLLLKETPNAQIHLIIALGAVILGFFFKITAYEWIAIISCIGIVFSMEAINSALERLSDYTCKKEIHPLIKKVKDLAAAAVVIVSLASLTIGMIIFLPKIF